MADRFVFAHLADAHVGAWPRAPALRKALRTSVLAALDVVARRNAEFLLISGDLFHTPVPEPGEAAPVAAALKRLVDAGRRVYVIYGSHDYVAHRTSWLDVLAAAGVFAKVAPEAVRADGAPWTLPYLVDAPTGARIAGISGRSHGLDRDYFRAVDATDFTAGPGFKVFQFHAAVEEYLADSLRGKVKGIQRADLPAGCDYYAGGHIHATYEGEGPTGGLLVNPGAVFGTSRPDLELAAEGRTHRGVVIVTVTDGVPVREFVDTTPPDVVQLVDVDVTGRSVEAARAEVERRVAAASGPAAVVFPRVHGTLVDGSLADLALGEVARSAARTGGSVTWDLRDLASADADAPAAVLEADVESSEIAALLAETAATAPWLDGPAGERVVRELLRELGVPKSEGESRIDYASARLTAARRILSVRETGGA